MGGPKRRVFANAVGVASAVIKGAMMLLATRAGEFAHWLVACKFRFRVGTRGTNSKVRDEPFAWTTYTEYYYSIYHSVCKTFLTVSNRDSVQLATKYFLQPGPFVCLLDAFLNVPQITVWF